MDLCDLARRWRITETYFAWVINPGTNMRERECDYFTVCIVLDERSRKWAVDWKSLRNMNPR